MRIVVAISKIEEGEESQINHMGLVIDNDDLIYIMHLFD